MNNIEGFTPAIYVLLGCPGAGKGTFAQSIKHKGYDHVSTGDITRDEVKNGTAFGIKYKDAILNHVIGGIPFEEIQRLIEERLENALQHHRGVILDGYPKTLEQCELLDAFIERNALRDRVMIVLFDINEEEAIDRIQFRQTCEKCNRIYNSKYSPANDIDTCDDCQGMLTKRMDYTIESTKKRVYEFKDRMGPVLDYYTSTNRLIRINGNMSPESSLSLLLEFQASQHLQKI